MICNESQLFFNQKKQSFFREGVPPAGYLLATRWLPVGFSLCVATQEGARQTLAGSIQIVLGRLGGDLGSTLSQLGADLRPTVGQLLANFGRLQSEFGRRLNFPPP